MTISSRSLRDKYSMRRATLDGVMRSIKRRDLWNVTQVSVRGSNLASIAITPLGSPVYRRPAVTYNMAFIAIASSSR